MKRKIMYSFLLFIMSVMAIKAHAQHSIGISTHQATLAVNDSIDLMVWTFCQDPFLPGDQMITTTISNPTVISVQPSYLNHNGQGDSLQIYHVRGLSPGTAYIVFTAHDGFTSDTCWITVGNAPTNIPVTGIQVPPTLTIPILSTNAVPVWISPYNATNQSVTAISTNPSVATINPSTGIVTPISAGSTYMVFTTVDGGYTDSCLVTIIASQNIPVTGIHVPYNTLTMNVNQNTFLIVNVLPINATYQGITATSSNPNIATVDSTSPHLIRAVSAGSCVIHYRTIDGGYVDSCIVTVAANPTNHQAEISGSVRLQDSSLVINGMACLYAVFQDSGFYWLVDTVLIQNGNYTFNNVGVGNYIINATAYGIPNAVPTYYGNTQSWLAATIITVTDSMPITNRNIIITTFNSLNGSAAINGYVAEDQNGGQSLSKSSVATPATGVNVFLHQKQLVSGEYTFIPIAQTQTDENGFYEFKNIPMGEYKIVLDIPGVGMTESYVVEITEENETVEGQNYQITEDGVKKLSIVQSVQNTNQYQVYPNPTNGILNIKTTNGNKKFVEVYNQEGKLVKRETISGTSSIVDIQNLTRGIYILQIEGKSTKIIKH